MSAKTLQAILKSIEMHEDKRRVLSSSKFTFSKVQNVVDNQTSELSFKITDTINALKRRHQKVTEIEAAMQVKIKTMLDQSTAALLI